MQGTKMFATQGKVANLFLVIAKVGCIPMSTMSKESVKFSYYLASVVMIFVGQLALIMTNHL